MHSKESTRVNRNEKMRKSNNNSELENVCCRLRGKLSSGCHVQRGSPRLTRFFMGSGVGFFCFVFLNFFRGDLLACVLLCHNKYGHLVPDRKVYEPLISVSTTLDCRLQGRSFPLCA